MSDSINSVSNSGLASISSGSTGSSAKLKDETKKKLEALGIDTSNITTEAEAQALLTKTASAQSAQKGEKPAQGNSTMADIRTQLDNLTAKMGVSTLKQDKIDDIFAKVSAKISDMEGTAGTDPSKLSDVKNYESTYTQLSTEYSKLEQSQSNMDKSMSAMANYNKAYYNL